MVDLELRSARECQSRHVLHSDQEFGGVGFIAQPQGIECALSEFLPYDLAVFRKHLGPYLRVQIQVVQIRGLKCLDFVIVSGNG